MAIRQEVILALLVEEGGKMKNSDLLNKFKDPLNCSDPAEKKQNRELFKMIINDLAVVKHTEEVKHIVLKKKYQHLLKSRSEGGKGEKDENEGGGVEQDTVEVKSAADLREVCEEEQAPEVAPEEMKSEQKSSSESEVQSSHSSPAPSFIELALQSQNYTDFRVKKSLGFAQLLTAGPDGPVCSNYTETKKRFALPLRMPPVTITPAEHEETHQIQMSSNDKSPVKVHMSPLSSTLGPPASPRYKRRSSVDSVGTSSSPQSRRHCKSVQPADDPKHGETFPLERSEHQWMVTSASGHWRTVYGLLLKDTQLADKRDFISGFTALHWAAKSGHRDMVCKIIDLSRQNGKSVDVNARSYAGYTPLHIAAIHRHEHVIVVLVNEYRANCHVRDNCGKKAHQYLDKDASHSIRELLGGLKVARAEAQKNTEDTDTHKHTHTISRLFQPQTIGYKKKPKSRSSVVSTAEDVREEKGEHSNPVHRVLSEVFP